jgi:hypothetical protein
MPPLIEKLISPPTDPALCQRAALAGLLVRLGFALLGQLELSSEEPPGWDLERLASVRSFRRGDRVRESTDDASTDPSDAAAERVALIIATAGADLRRHLRDLSLRGQEKALRSNLRYALADVPPDILAGLERAAEQRPPRQPIPLADGRAADRNTARLLKLLARIATAVSSPAV